MDQCLLLLQQRRNTPPEHPLALQPQVPDLDSSSSADERGTAVPKCCGRQELPVSSVLMLRVRSAAVQAGAQLNKCQFVEIQIPSVESVNFPRSRKGDNT